MGIQNYNYKSHFENIRDDALIDDRIHFFSTRAQILDFRKHGKNQGGYVDIYFFNHKTYFISTLSKGSAKESSQYMQDLRMFKENSIDVTIYGIIDKKGAQKQIPTFTLHRVEHRNIDVILPKIVHPTYDGRDK